MEDEPSIRDGVQEMLSRRISRLFIASNGADGLELFMAEKPDIVITDIRMPRMNGLEMSRKIKEINKHVQVIVTSAHSDSSYFIDAIEIGVNQYVLKPISRDKLYEAIQKSYEVINLEKQVQRQMQTILKLHGAIEQSHSMVVITDKDMAVEYVNPRFTHILGYELPELTDTTNPHNLRNLFSEALSAIVVNSLYQGQQWSGEYITRHRDGQDIWLYGSITPVKDPEGQITSFVKVAEDISEIKQITLALAESEDRLRNLIANLGEGIGIIDLTYEFTFCNEALAEIFEMEELAGQNFGCFLTSPVELKKLSGLSRKLRMGDKMQFDTYIRTQKGNIKNISITMTPQLDKNGVGIIGSFCIFKDMSQIKQLIEEIETAREEAEKAYQTIEIKNHELRDANEKLQLSEVKLSQLNEILMEYIKATGK